MSTFPLQLIATHETPQNSKSRRFKATSGGDKGPVTVGGWIRRRIDDITPDALDIPETLEYVPVNYEQESLGELRFCPMSIEVNDQRILKNRRRRTVYLLPWLETYPQSSSQNNTMTSLLAASGIDILDEKTRNKLAVRFRSYSEISKVFPMLAIPRLHKNKKLSAEERKRRQIVESYKNLVQKSGTPAQFAIVESFMNTSTTLDQSILENSHAPSVVSRSRSKVVVPSLSRETSVAASIANATEGATAAATTTGSVDASQKFEGTVCMAISSRHWSENVLRITKSGISILPNSESVRAYTNISIKSIFCIRQMKKEETPIFFLKSLAFFQIETFARVYYFMVKEKYISSWLQFFLMMYGSTIVKLSSDPIGKVLYTFPEPAEAYIARPTCWKLDKKRIFNYRRIIFSPKCIPVKYQSSSPNEIIEDILASAFALSVAESTSSAEALDWVKFLDDITVVQTLNFSKLNEKDKIAFLLNIYHLMVVHASLILGPPLSWASWQGFFNSSYLLAFDIISISEVEYNLLRAAMSAPSPILSKLAVPYSHYPGLALTQKDFRLNFCINCGTQSSPAVVPIYRVNTLDAQMDEVSCCSSIQ